MTGASTGRAAFVVNAASAAGRALCSALAERGCAVASTSPPDDGLAFREGIERLGVAYHASSVPSCSAEKLSSAIVGAAEHFGALDALFFVQAARRGEDEGKMLLDLDEEDWDQAMDGGAKAFFLSCKYILPYLISREGARIVVLDETPPEKSECGLAEYVSAHALASAIEHISLELSYYGISASYKQISPGNNWIPEVLENIA